MSADARWSASQAETGEYEWARRREAEAEARRRREQVERLELRERHASAIADTGDGYVAERGWAIRCLWCDWRAVRRTRAEAVAAYREHEAAVLGA